MTKYSFEAVQKALGTPPVIPGRPTWSTLWPFRCHLIDGLRKLNYPRQEREGFAPYLRTNDEQALVSTIPWQQPADPGQFFRPSARALGNRMIYANEEGEYNVKKELSDGFEVIEAALVEIMEHCIDEAYHTGSTTLGQKGYGNLTARNIIFRLFHLYGKPTLQEVNDALARLSSPMDRLDTIEVMLKSVEEVQMFLLADQTEDRSLKESQMITYAMIKMNSTGLYIKALEKWGLEDDADRRRWSHFRTFMIQQYEKMLKEHGGPTIKNQGYGAAFSATQDETSVGDDSAGSIIASVTKYAERATAAEQELDDVKDALSTLQYQFAAMMNGNMQQPPSTIHINKKRKSPLETMGMPPQQQPAQLNVNQAMGWQQPTTPMGSYGQAIWGFPPQRQQQQQQPMQWAPGKPNGGGGGPPGGHFSNRNKIFQNLYYCFTCGYDVDHPGNMCPRAKQGHIPNVPRDQAHLCPGACMKGQHRMLPDGTGQGKGWIQAQGMNKAFYTMAKQGQQPWASVYGQQQQGRGGGRGSGRGRGGRGRGYGRGGGGGGRRNWQWGANNTQWQPGY